MARHRKQGFFGWLGGLLRPKKAPPPPPPPVTPPEPPKLPPVEPPKLPPGPGIFLDPLIRDNVRDTARLGVPGDDSDPDGRAEQLIADVGGANAYDITFKQNESTYAYISGDATLGHDRFVDQVEYLQSRGVLNVEAEWLFNRKGQRTYRVAKKFVTWFYYHGTGRRI